MTWILWALFHLNGAVYISPVDAYGTKDECISAASNAVVEVDPGVTVELACLLVSDS